MLTLLIFAVFGGFSLTLAKTVQYQWDITWVTAAPDGYARPVIGVNGQWPCPSLDLNLNDRVIIDVYNGLGNQSTGIHWHGISQKGSNFMDGSPGVTQCRIPPGGRMTYDFVVDQTGTYWWHSHDPGQYPDGLYGPLIVRDSSDPYSDIIDGEFTITLTDWYHEQMPNLLEIYQSTQNVQTNSGDEPSPDSVLINSSTNSKINVLPGKTYLVRIICAGTFSGHGFLFDQHNMTVVEVDGVWLQEYPTGAQNVRIATGQRMSVLIHTKNSTSTNYAIWDTMDPSMLFLDEGKTIPSGYNLNGTAYLVYNQNASLPAPPVISALDFVDDINFTPYDLTPVLEPVDHYITIDMNSAVLNGVERFTINNSTYLQPEVPSLYSAITLPANYTSDPIVYGHVNPIILKYGEIVQIAINDYHENLHPFHLHGHHFQVLERNGPNGGYFTGTIGNYSQTPVIRDTIMVQNGGMAVIRFKADNPGIWLFHCHIEWHVDAGLTATIIEAPEMLGNITIPKDHLAVCAEYPTPTSGNADGNTTYPLSLNASETNVPQGDDGAMYPRLVPVKSK